MKPLSIKLRLSLLVSLLTFTIIVVVSVVAYVELQESLMRNVDEILRAMGEGIIATLDEHEDPQAREAEFRSIIGNKTRGSAWCRVWMDGSDSDLFLSDLPRGASIEELLGPPPKEQPAIGESSLFNVIGQSARGRKNRHRAIWLRRVQEQEVVNVLVGRSSAYVYHELGEFYQLLLILGGGLTLCAFLTVPVFISWGLNPVAQASAQLQTITHKSLGRERERSGVPPELEPFMTALDEMLARLDRAMQQQGQFIADAAHELRTPVAIVKSTLQTANLRPRTAAEYEENINEALQDVGRLERLIAQLLSLARLERPDTLRRPVRFRLDVLLNEVVGTCDIRAARQNSRVVFPQVGAIWVRGNENELRQLFDNLLDNALRYGPPGGTVRVALEARDNEVVVSMRDEGGRIPAEALPHLFDRFYRVDSSRSQTSGGTGLGLAIAREIARRHEGDVKIISNPEAGTVVSVNLPRW
jgi:two-component system heavy metal sensor histidine kinase CusS